ncbi:mannosyltransferase family protein [Leifsonia sp. NPDC058230]|uniref:mannosyltransferase family protein n=1 Tax=Leifsonia sp. NPDC058230 TaxID=3346391 RepID=UPI0036DF7B91
MGVKERIGVLTEGVVATRARIRVAGREYRWWVVVLVVFAASRVFTTTLMLTLFVAASAGHWHFESSRADPSFFTFSGSWDASYYRRIAEHGYPTVIPTDADGNVVQNAWAFLPLFPWIIRGLTFVTGLGFYPAAVIVATVFGAAATLVLYRLVASRVGPTSGLWAVLLFSFGPLSFVLQVAYAESLFFFLMFSALWAMMSRRYWWIIPLGVAAAFTKPGELALPLALAVVFVVRFVQWRRARIPFPGRERAAMIVAGVVTAVAGFAWPVIATAVTGFPDAYVKTELSWWTGFVGRVEFVPLTPWLLFTWKYAGVFGALLVAVVIAAFVWMLTRPSVRALGVEVIAFSASYALYLFAVFLPQQSLFRLLMPLAPLGGAPGLTHNRRARMIVLICGIALQPVALLLLWYLGYP